MDSPRRRYESRVRKSTLKLSYWSVAWVLACASLAFGDKLFWQEGSNASTVITAAIAVLVGIGMVIAYKNYLKDVDELQQKLLLEAMGITLGVPLAVGMPYFLLIETGVAPSEDWFGYLIVLMSLTFFASLIAGYWRHR